MVIVIIIMTTFVGVRLLLYHFGPSQTKPKTMALLREEVQEFCAKCVLAFLGGGMPVTYSSFSSNPSFPSSQSSHLPFPMDRHRCKLCPCSFVTSRALGGHMKAHLASHSLSPRPTPHIPPTLSSTTSPDVEPSAIYRLRENPRKSIKFSDPEFSLSVVVHDGESEAESRDRRRKRRSGRRIVGGDDVESPEAEPVSSVSDTSLEEDIAMCLMMLSQDNGWRNPAKKFVENGVAALASQEKQHQHHQCEICKKWFRSSQALGGHRIIHRKKVIVAGVKIAANNKHNLNHEHNDNDGYVDESSRIFECPFCGKVFGSGQALGGHKRSHLMGGFDRSSSLAAGGGEKISCGKNSSKNNGSLIDLNMPAPAEDEDVYSILVGCCPTNY